MKFENFAQYHLPNIIVFIDGNHVFFGRSNVKLRAKFFIMKHPNFSPSKWFSITTFLLGLFFSATPAQGQGTWAAAQNLPAPRIYMNATEFKGKIYVFGGTAIPPNTSDSTVFVYDTATMAWSLHGYMPQTICVMSVVIVEDTIYIIGGGPTVFGTPSGEAYAFDPVANIWKQKANMITPRSAFAASVLDGKIYTIGGLIGESSSNVIPSNAVEVYDPKTDTWTSKNPFPYKVIDAVAATVGDSLFVIGGSTGYPFLGLTNSYRYAPLNDNWTTITFMPTGRWGAPAVVLNDKIHVIGGTPDLTNHLAKMEVYDPASDSWTSETPMPTARRSFAAATLGGKIYAMGGLGNDVLNKVEVFTPASSAVGELETAKSEMLQVYPTPSNQPTMVRYQVAQSGEIEILLFDASNALRQQVARNWHTPGEYTAWVEATALENGVYVCVMRSGAKLLAVRKVVVQK